MKEKNESSSSSRIASVPSSVMLGLADKIRELEFKGEKVIDLSLGQPEVPAPDHIARATERALQIPQTDYASSEGSRELRSLIAERYSLDARVPTNESEVIITSGSKHALFVTLLSLIDPEDEILVPEPYFPPYKEIAALIGGRLKSIPAKISGDQKSFSFDVEDLINAVSSKTRVVLLNYPNNPAGWTLDESQVKQITEFCTSNDIYLVSDEIYDKIVFDGRKHCHAWRFSTGTDSIVGIGSFSKTYSMVPYRLGFIVVRKKVKENILKSIRATLTFVSPYLQSAGVAALRGPQDFVASRLKTYEERRDYCLSILKKHNIEAPIPSGAFYLFIPLPRNVDASDFALKLLQKRKVAIFPGSIFGERWKGFVRISTATDDSKLKSGVEEFASMVASLEKT